MKKVTIGDTEYSLECNAFTRVLYKKTFGTQIFKDLASITSFYEKIGKIDTKDISDEEKESEKNQLTLENLDDVMDTILKIAYIEIYTYDRHFMSFEQWLETMKKISLSDGWVGEVVTIATDCFC